MSLLKLVDVNLDLNLKPTPSSILKNINLDIKRGDFVVLMGSNDITRSSLLKIIGLILKPTQGSYVFQSGLVDGLSQKHKTLLRRNNIGFIFQDFNLLPNLNVLENVSLPLFYTTKLSTRQRYRQAQVLLTRLGVYKKDYLYPSQLTLTMQQRVAVARALINEPVLLLADQPTTYLDNLGSAIIMNILENRHQMGETIILATNNPKLSKYANRILYLDDGRLRVDTSLDHNQEVDLNKIQAAVLKQNLKLRSQAMSSKQKVEN